ncbi:MAG: signal peptidase I [Lachnospiraceae bacterium]|nr:signal peptidase I [Lachnospiraceae bacterium]
MKTVKKVVGVLLSVFLWAIILITALFTFTTLATRDERSVSRFLGYTPLIVKSQSMAPTFNEGDLIIIKQYDPAKLKVGDIITFHTIINNEFALNTHRIDRIDEKGGSRSYVTKGDNNAIADTHMIADGDIVGKYVGKLSAVGRLMAFLSSSTGFLLVIVLPMLLFFIYQVYHLVMVSINLKKAMAVEEATEAAQKEEEAAAKLAEAEAALAEAKRLKEEAEAKLAAAGGAPVAKEEPAKEPSSDEPSASNDDTEA